MRIIGGTLRGRRLAPVPRHGVRPTADPVREALFNILGPGIAGRSFVDLAAGSGAVGLEAFSRGAEPVVLVERSRAALKVIQSNLARLGLENETRVRVVAADVGAWLDRRVGPRPVGVAFLDPPWETRSLSRWIGRLADGGWLDGESLVIVEHRAGDVPPLPGLETVWRRRYGDSSLTCGRLPRDPSEQSETG